MYTTRHTVPSVIGQYNQLAAQLGQPAFASEDKTLNSFLKAKYSSPAGSAAVGVTNSAHMKYFGIGISGSSTNTSTVNDINVATLTPHTPDETNQLPYNMLPVHMVIDTAEVAPEEENYAMKQIINFNGSAYRVYWLKKIFLDANAIKLDIVDGLSTLEYVVPDITVPAVTDSVVDTQDIIVSATLKCPLSGGELTSVIEFFLDGNRAHANISEYGIFSGVWDPNANGGAGDVANAQLALHRTLPGHDLSSPRTQITEVFNIEVGNSLISRAFDS